MVPSRLSRGRIDAVCRVPGTGAVPVVSRVGGLEDTVVDLSDDKQEITGFKFSPVTAQKLAAAASSASRPIADAPALQRCN